MSNTTTQLPPGFLPPGVTLDNSTLAPEVLSSAWSLTALAGVFLGLRVFAKLYTRRGLWLDDYVLIASWVSDQYIHISAACMILYSGANQWSSTISGHSLRHRNTHHHRCATRPRQACIQRASGRCRGLEPHQQHHHYSNDHICRPEQNIFCNHSLAARVWVDDKVHLVHHHLDELLSGHQYRH